MQIDYDPQANAIYIRLRAGEVDDTVEAGKNFNQPFSFKRHSCLRGTPATPPQTRRR